MRAQCLLAVTTSCARDQVAKNPPNPNTTPSGGPPSPAHSPYRLLEGWTNPNPNPCERRTYRILLTVMASKGRLPPHLRRSLPVPGMLHPEPFGPGIRPPPGAFPFDVLPPEIMEQKLAHQHMEMQRLATENQRLAATHSTLRQQLAAAQQDLQRLQTRSGAVHAEQEQQLRGLKEKIAMMEADLKAAEPIKVELQHARAEAQSLIAAREELIPKVQQLTQDLQKSYGDLQQIPALMSELDAVRQEYQHCRATYDYERKLRIDHYESLQVMERNYISMVREVEKLRAELTNATNLDRSGASALGGPFGTSAVHRENDSSGHHSGGQNAYEEGYRVSQGRGPSSGAASYGGGPAGPASVQAGYDAPRGPTYDAPRNASYDASRIAGYDASRGSSYEAPRGAGYEAPIRSGYDAPRGSGVPQAAVAAGSNAAPYGSTQAPPAYGSAQMPSPYGSTQPPTYGSGQTPTRAGGGYEAPRGGNAVRR